MIAATTPVTVEALASSAAIDRSFARQVGRRIREAGKLPTRRGNNAAQISASQLSMLIVASALGPGVKAAVERALALPPQFFTFVTGLVDHAWSNPNDPYFEFGTLKIDLSTASAVAIELSDGNKPVSKQFGEPPASNSASRQASISFAVIRDVVNTIRSSRVHRVHS